MSLNLRIDNDTENQTPIPELSPRRKSLNNLEHEYQKNKREFNALYDVVEYLVPKINDIEDKTLIFDLHEIFRELNIRQIKPKEIVEFIQDCLNEYNIYVHVIDNYQPDTGHIHISVSST